MMRIITVLFFTLVMAGCSVLPFGRSAAGVKVVGSNDYCGTPSQQPEVHYFAGTNEFQNWIDYRNIRGFTGKMARDGLLVVEMGMRPTSGYKLLLNGDNTGLDDDTLNVGLRWQAPSEDAAVNQNTITQCVAMTLPKDKDYRQVRVIDQLDHEHGLIKADALSHDDD